MLKLSVIFTSPVSSLHNVTKTAPICKKPIQKISNESVRNEVSKIDNNIQAAAPKFTPEDILGHIAPSNSHHAKEHPTI